MYLLFLLLAAFSLSALSCNVSAKAAILINADTGATLFCKNADTPLFPASTTKIATALYILQSSKEDLHTTLVAKKAAIASISAIEKRKQGYCHPPHLLETNASHIGIKQGEELSLKDLLYAVLLGSANDACNVVAQYRGEGSIEGFMQQLNCYLKGLGCKHTHFVNPHGLHHPKHQTTARDLALIAQAALQEPLFRDIVKTRSYTIPATNKQPARTIVQTNRLLRKGGEHYYDKAIGIKTGHTSDAGYALIAAAKEEGRTLIAVVLGCEEKKDVYEDVTRLFKSAFAEQKQRKTILKKGRQPYRLSLQQASRELETMTKEEVCLAYYPAEDAPVELDLQWNALTPPIAAGAEVATLHIKQWDKVVMTAPLFAARGVPLSFWYKVRLLPLWVKIAIALAIVVLLACLFKMRR